MNITLSRTSERNNFVTKYYVNRNSVYYVKVLCKVLAIKKRNKKRNSPKNEAKNRSFELDIKSKSATMQHPLS